jgi:glucose uptake protein
VWGTGVGSLIFGIGMLALIPISIDGKTWLLGMAAGFAWMVGQVGQYYGIAHLGVSRVMPLSTGLQILGTSILSVLFFGEWRTMTAKLIGTVALLLVIFGALLTARTDRRVQKISTHRDNFQWPLFILTSAGYWVFGSLPKLSAATGAELVVPEMIGAGVAALCYLAVSRRINVWSDQEAWRNVPVGIIFGGATLAYIIAAKRVGVANAFIMGQMAVVVSTVGAILMLRENKRPKERIWTGLGICFMVVGLILISR